MCLEHFGIFGSTNHRGSFANKTIKHLFVLISKNCFSKILLQRKMEPFSYHFYTGTRRGGLLNYLLFLKKSKFEVFFENKTKKLR